LPEDFLFQDSAEVSFFAAFVFSAAGKRGLGELVAALGTERRGGLPPVLALAAIAHSFLHMLAVQTISTARAHFAVCVHCLNWGH
jgi:hypothetical protein